MTIYSDPYAVQEAKSKREKSDWPEDKSRLLQTLWNQGYQPFRIAEEIGATSGGAVIAQAKRLRDLGWNIKWRNPAGRTR